MQQTMEAKTTAPTWNSPAFEYVPVNCEVTSYSSGELEPDSDGI